MARVSCSGIDAVRHLYPLTHYAEVLKQPLQTSITVDIKEFDDFDVEEQLHIGISVKDFKNFVVHADTLRTSVLAMYSQPGRPLQFTYSGEGVQCDLTLMTMGESRSTGSASVARPTTRLGATRQTSVNSRSADQSMPPPPLRPRSGPDARLGSRQPEAASALSHRGDSPLFVPPDDDDRQWDPTEDQDQDQGGDRLGWDASAENVRSSSALVLTLYFTNAVQDAPIRGSAFRDTSRMTIERHQERDHSQHA